MAKKCKIHPAPPATIKPAPQMTIYSLTAIHIAIKKGFVVTMAGHEGKVVSIRAEDKSGLNWLVRFAKPWSFSFFGITFTIYRNEKHEVFVKAR